MAFLLSQYLIYPFSIPTPNNVIAVAFPDSAFGNLSGQSEKHLQEQWLSASTSTTTIRAS
jgi:hypothetical protein